MAGFPVTSIDATGGFRHQTSRRTFLQAGALALGSLAAGNVVALEPDKAASQKPIVFVRFDGGASLHDMWDMEPHSRVDRVYPQGIQTSVPGLEISPDLPKMAGVMDKVMLIKSLAPQNGNHFYAQALMTIGDREESSPQSYDFKHDGPFIELRKQQPRIGLSNVVMDAQWAGRQKAIGLVDNVELHSTRNTEGSFDNPFGEQGVGLGRLNDRRDLLGRLTQHSRQLPGTEGFDAAHDQGFTTIKLNPGEAFDLDGASKPELARYGADEDNPFAKSLLIAKRLIEKGVPVVSVTDGGWDNHGNIKGALSRSLPRIDKSFAALIEDIDAMGGIVVATTEFARTPKINGNNGRDHFPAANFGIISGVHPGRVVGKLDSGGAAVTPLPADKFLRTAVYAAGYEPLYLRNGGVLTSVKLDGLSEQELST